MLPGFVGLCLRLNILCRGYLVCESFQWALTFLGTFHVPPVLMILTGFYPPTQHAHTETNIWQIFLKGLFLFLKFTNYPLLVNRNCMVITVMWKHTLNVSLWPLWHKIRFLVSNKLCTRVLKENIDFLLWRMGVLGDIPFTKDLLVWFKRSVY